MSEIVLKIENLSKIYQDGNSEKSVLNNISLSLEAGKSIAICGPSGCGKTTLLQLCALMDDNYSGKIEICDQDIAKITGSEKDVIRKGKFGFIHQFHHLFPEFSVIENVIFSKLNNDIDKKIAIECAKQVLKDVGLGEKADYHPWQLSGGERQRVAIARAVINKPKIIFADEPTGNLDPENSIIVMKLMLDLCAKSNTSILLVTHNHDFAAMCDMQVYI
ncbi:ABC transporter ATP-binding protein [Candidatus Deianiraea vastatrix]|uniref:Lipoprotein-releasing system ATP-binding protein LolD n=1 Tax=Candidatus Deianiraea vastatrix TaxID=2163644 RepID=A0A5B8XE31_9RICK|nr:ABC transporter ATP-binding protein [Candidatus Deianiraea vastatrix]QED23568.1 Lipoprotein-releasing system ATP-binding protein LolD [Candidatus Deianiraea vastatrix]